MTTTTRPNLQHYLTIRRAMNALRDEQFRILTSDRRDLVRYDAIERQLAELRKKLEETA